MQKINIKDIKDNLPKDCIFQLCFNGMLYVAVETAKDINSNDLKDLTSKFRENVYDKTVVLRVGNTENIFRLYFNGDAGDEITLCGDETNNGLSLTDDISISFDGKNVLMSQDKHLKTVDKDEYLKGYVEPTLTVHDIRGKLSPVTHLLSLLEMEGERAKQLLPNAIIGAKRSVNYLAQRECFKLEEDGE